MVLKVKIGSPHFFLESSLMDQDLKGDISLSMIVPLERPSFP